MGIKTKRGNKSKAEKKTKRVLGKIQKVGGKGAEWTGSRERKGKGWDTLGEKEVKIKCRTDSFNWQQGSRTSEKKRRSP